MAIELTERDRAVLDHIRRYRITVSRTLQEQFCDRSENAAKKLVARLRDYVASETLVGNSVYYRLTPLGARLLGAPEEIAQPLGVQALPRAFGVLAFCCNGQTQRWRYTRPEFGEDFPELAEEMLKNDYYLDFYMDSDGMTVRLGHILVDLGGSCEQILKKCRGRIRRYQRTIPAELFAIAIVVPSDEKRQGIKDALKQRPLRAWLRIEVVPELGQLIAN
jgi:hypothetical protein